MKDSDVRKEVQLDGITDEMRAARLKMAEPGYCGSCYGADTPQKQCCNSCDEVKVAYRNMGWALSIDSMEQCIAEGQTTASIQHDLQEGQGCQMVGFLEVNKVRVHCFLRAPCGAVLTSAHICFACRSLATFISRRASLFSSRTCMFMVC